MCVCVCSSKIKQNGLLESEKKKTSRKVGWKIITLELVLNVTVLKARVITVSRTTYSPLFLPEVPLGAFNGYQPTNSSNIPYCYDYLLQYNQPGQQMKASLSVFESPNSNF